MLFGTGLTIIVLGSVFFLVQALRHAPIGYQNEGGFHSIMPGSKGSADSAIGSVRRPFRGTITKAPEQHPQILGSPHRMAVR